MKIRKIIIITTLAILTLSCSILSASATSLNDLMREKAMRMDKTPIICNYSRQKERPTLRHFSFNNPDIFWTCGSGGNAWSSKGRIKEVDMLYTMSEADVKKRRPIVNKKIRKIVRKAKKEKTDKGKIKVVNAELCKMIKYKTTLNSSNVYGALGEGRAVCAGYAKAFCLCMRQLKIPCGYEFGNTPRGRHVWNTVLVKEKKKGKTIRRKYIVDVTWNDSSQSNRFLLVKKYPYKCDASIKPK